MKKNKKNTKRVAVAQSVPVVETPASEATPKKKRRFTRRTLIKLMFVISVIFIMISLTYSWFSASTSARVEGLKIEVTDPNNLTADGIAAKGVINSVAGDGTSFFYPKREKTLVGKDGIYNLYKNEKTGEYTPLDDKVTLAEPVVENVLVKDFSLSINGSFDIYMINGTEITSEENGSAYLAGAMRVAVLKLNAETNEYEPLLIWIPDVTTTKSGGSELEDEYTIVYPDGEEIKQKTLIVTGESGETTLDLNGESGETTLDDGVRYVWGEINENRTVCMDRLENSAKYRCVIWLDGNDRECDNELANQSVVATFKFLPKAIDEEIGE